MSETRYLQPSCVEELVQALGQMTDKSAVLAGGTDLMIAIRNKLPEIDCLLSLCRVEELAEIRKEEGWLSVGAMATHAQIAANSLVRNYFPALSMACDHVGSKQIRNKGTIGGSLANASAAGDMLPCVYLFHGEVEILDWEGKARRVPAEEFYQGISRTCLKTGEILKSIWLPVHEERNSCFVKLGGRKEVTIAEISLALSWVRDAEGYHQIEGILGAVDSRPIRLEEADRILSGRKINREQKEALAESLSQRIQVIRENRKRAPKLRIRECEKVYKEYAVKGVVYDAIELIEGQV